MAVGLSYQDENLLVYIMDRRNGYNFREEVAQATMRILRQKTKQSIAIKLDARKLLLTEERLHRDWRGLAEEANLDASVIRSSKISFTEHCFHLWTQKGAVIGELWKALINMDRYDVIDDTLEIIYGDYDYALSKDVLGLRLIPPPIEEVQSSISDFDSNILTTDDQRNINDGGSLQFYDALVLFADEDLDFVDEMVQKLEGEYKLKLCLRARDLLGGLAFEFSALMRLIEERCARVIVVLSPAFLRSNANKFLIQFAHSLSVALRLYGLVSNRISSIRRFVFVLHGLHQPGMIPPDQTHRQTRIVIPCMYKPCQKPLELAFCHTLDFFRPVTYWDYWKKLADSLAYKQSGNRWANSNSAPGPVIREITYPAVTSSSVVAVPTSITSSNTESRSLPTSSPPSVGILSRIRRRTDEKTEKRILRGSQLEPISLSGSFDSESAFKNTSGESVRASTLSLPSIPPDLNDLTGSSGYSYGSNRSPTSPTSSIAPLLPSRTKQNGLKNMFRKVIRIKKNRQLPV